MREIVRRIGAPMATVIRWLRPYPLSDAEEAVNLAAAHRARRKREDVACRSCSAVFAPKWSSARFCSRSCAAKVTNSEVPRRRKKPRFCERCNGLPQAKSRFCETCTRRPSPEMYIAAWLSGAIGGAVGERPSSLIRRYLLSQASFACSQCGWSVRNKHTGVVPLQVDHIDGDYRNNRPENLRVLCPNCHALTPTYGSRNRGRGRPNRAQWRARRRLAATL
jgi:hypothetical protein